MKAGVLRNLRPPGGSGRVIWSRAPAPDPEVIMVKKKTPQEPPAAATTAPTNGAGMSKMEAVRRALAQLGREAKPLQIKDYIKSEFGIEMGADHISTYKGDILKKAGRRSKPGPKPK